MSPSGWFGRPGRCYDDSMKKPPYFFRYLLGALEAAPDLFDVAVAGMTDREADLRPDPQRFTLREALCHVADWENVFLERLVRIRDLDTPALQGYDEGQWAIDHDYAHQDWREQIRLIGERRPRIVSLLRALSPDDWERAGNHCEIGPITLETLATLIALHDTYHLRQIADYRKTDATP